MLKGKITLKGDKSISHRVLILGSLVSDRCNIYNISRCEDVQRTLNILKKCNINIKQKKNKTIIIKSQIKQKNKRFYCGNSGTTARFMLGFLPSIGISGTIYGDQSLSKRPMKRLIEPLLKMNVKIKKVKENLPITFEKSKIKPINFSIKNPSAQIKTALIFAALSSKEKSFIKDPFNTRDHTENMIEYLGGPKGYYNKFKINNFNYTVPGDISSASFIITAALLIEKSNIIIKEVLFNKTRIGYINTLIKMGAKIIILKKRKMYRETIADINIKYSKKLKGISVAHSDVVNMIDEIPLFALVACYAKGTTRVNHAIELRYKESDRIKSIVYNLKRCGGNIRETSDGFVIKQSSLLYNTSINDFQDHRITMMCEILKLVNSSGFFTENKNNHTINTSFPEFYQHLRDLYV
jgi:3-phosphoshikimate 1-carboxyvinyltransferase